MRKKYDDDEIEDEEEINTERWDIKRIVIGFPVIIFVLIFLVKILPPRVSEFSTRVLGVSEKAVPEQKVPFSETKQEASKLLEHAKQTLSTIQTEDISSDAGTLQKVINDLKSLQTRSRNPKDVLCEYVCKE